MTKIVTKKGGSLLIDYKSLLKMPGKYSQKIILVKDNLIINTLLTEIVEEIGRVYSDEIKGNTRRNKGLKKISQYCKKEYKEEITSSEIKYLFSSKSSLFRKHEYIKIPYSTIIIIKTIISLSSHNLKIKELCVEYLTRKEIDHTITCSILLIPKYINELHKTIDIISKKEDEKGTIPIFENLYRKLIVLSNEIRDEFTNSCELIK